MNAAVFSDLSFWNLFLTPRKNLEVGLGAVNALSLDEFKAVVAHEFGHFAQRTMRVGSWVYLAHQIIADLVSRRDILDRSLEMLSRVDFRIAWIGWLMRLVVWAIRSVLDTAFRGVIALQRALSRQMEFQADLVAVSLTGSDSIVHALYRLGAADDAWRRAADYAARQAGAGRRVDDLFGVQSHLLDKLRHAHGDPQYGCTPPRPEAEAGANRVFMAGVAEAPRMWATHPPNHERELNAKRRYVASPLDDRPAWVLFRDPEARRRELTASILAPFEELGPEGPPLSEHLEDIDRSFARPHLDRRFHGAYRGRPIARIQANVFGLFETHLPEETGLGAALDGLYPEELGEQLDRMAELGAEVAAL